MKITFTPVITKATKYTKIPKNNIPNRISTNNATDTVSFGAIKSHNEMMLDELQESFNEKIKPFAEENKELQKDLGLIGYKAQCAENEIKKESGKVSTQMMQMLIDEENPYIADIKPYIEISDKSAKNNLEFSRLMSLSEQEMYESSHKLKEEIAKTAIIFNNSNEINKLIPLKESMCQARNNVSSKTTITTPDFQKKIKDTIQTKNEALAWLVVLPYQSAANLQDEITKTRENLNVPKRIWYEDEKTIERMFKKEKLILESIEQFNKYQKDIIAFVKKHKNSQNEFPSKQEIQETFEKVTKNNKQVYDENYTQVKETFEKNYTQKGIQLDIEKLNEEINAQNEAIENLQNIVEKIKSDYIAKQNAEFFKEYYQ